MNAWIPTLHDKVHRSSLSAYETRMTFLRFSASWVISTVQEQRDCHVCPCGSFPCARCCPPSSTTRSFPRTRRLPGNSPPPFYQTSWHWMTTKLAPLAGLTESLLGSPSPRNPSPVGSAVLRTAPHRTVNDCDTSFHGLGTTIKRALKV